MCDLGLPCGEPSCPFTPKRQSVGAAVTARPDTDARERFAAQAGMRGWRWLDGHALGPGLYYRNRRIVPVSVWLLRPRFMWRTRGAR